MGAPLQRLQCEPTFDTVKTLSGLVSIHRTKQGTDDNLAVDAGEAVAHGMPDVVLCLLWQHPLQHAMQILHTLARLRAAPHPLSKAGQNARVCTVYCFFSAACRSQKREWCCETSFTPQTCSTKAHTSKMRPMTVPCAVPGMSCTSTVCALLPLRAHA